MDWARRHLIVVACIAALLGAATGTGIGSVGASQLSTIATRTETETDYSTQTETVVKRRRARTETVTETKTETVTVPDTTTTDDGGSPPPDPNCSPEYEGACVPADAGDVDCGEIPETDFDSVGSDPYGLDRDGDGVACES